jgi:hypothetical protein
MTETTPLAISPAEALRFAPKACAMSVAGLLFIWALHGLSFVPVVMAPVTGSLAFGSLIAYWRTNKNWLSSMPFILLVIPCISAGESVWYVLQYMGLAVLFMYLPLLLFGKLLVRWASRAHS